MKKIVFIKFGGSLITEKDQAMMARHNVTRRLAKQLAQIVNAKPELQFVIGNGAGSFGHYQVIQYGLKDGISKPEQWYGFSVVQDSVAQLNRIFIGALLKENVPVISLQPSAIFTAKDGKLEQSQLHSFISILKAGMIPSVYGDIILDSKRGCTIFSTETIFDILLNDLLRKNYEIHSVIHLTRVNGVLDKNNVVIPQITKDNWGKVQKSISRTDGYDVTGGMKHKIKTGLSYAKKNVSTCIVNGEEEKILYKLLVENKQIGTAIH